MGPTITCNLYTQQDPIEENNFSYASDCQLEIFFWLGKEVVFFISALGPHLTWICAEPVLNFHISATFIWL